VAKGGWPGHGPARPTKLSATEWLGGQYTATVTGQRGLIIGGPLVA